jgi:hypothetical protein
MSAERIRELNDAFRSTFSGGKVVMTNSVYQLPACVRANALVKVATFNEFTGDNDPYEEHDFSFFNLVGRTFYWKIDYYDERCEFGSVDPADPEKTTRVLTLMLAEDY